MTQRHVARAHIRTRMHTHTHTHTRMHTVKTTQECPPRQTVQKYSASHIALVDTWDNCPWGALVVQNKKEKKKGNLDVAAHITSKKKKGSVAAMREQWHSCQQHLCDVPEKSCYVSSSMHMTCCLLFQGSHQLFSPARNHSWEYVLVAVQNPSVKTQSRHDEWATHGARLEREKMF